jgi:hypothetical protein
MIAIAKFQQVHATQQFNVGVSVTFMREDVFQKDVWVVVKPEVQFANVEFAHFRSQEKGVDSADIQSSSDE